MSSDSPQNDPKGDAQNVAEAAASVSQLTDVEDVVSVSENNDGLDAAMGGESCQALPEKVAAADAAKPMLPTENSNENEPVSALLGASIQALSEHQLQNIIEAALLAAGQPLSIDRLLTLFMDINQPSRDEIRTALAVLSDACALRGIELIEVGSGFRYQAKQENAEWVARLWEEKPARYSRALLETLALIAYRQPITRGEIEDIRGVSVSTNIMKTLLERNWVKVVGHRDVPGKPAMYASTRQFLDYFNLKNLSELPSLAEIRDIDSINAELDLAEPDANKKLAEADTSTTVQTTAELDLAANDDAVDDADAETSPTVADHDEHTITSETTPVLDDNEEGEVSTDLTVDGIVDASDKTEVEPS
jgi:segregation and condensation protein B